MMNPTFNFEISLAQWSLHQALFSKEFDTLDFPRIARERYAIGAVEYVNQFFKDQPRNFDFLHELKLNSDKVEVRNLLIMIDDEGELADARAPARHAAVAGHVKWMDAAAFLGCSAVRVNLKGVASESEWGQGSVESLRTLGLYAKGKGLKVLVENHGSFSSKASLLMRILKAVHLPNVGTMPDFGNFCVRQEMSEGGLLPASAEEYDRYLGVEEMLPLAGAMSAKTYDFDALGEETTIDFHRMMGVVRASGYRGFIGIEYEGTRLSEHEGIVLTKALLERFQGTNP